MYFMFKNIALNKGVNALEDRTIVLKQNEDISLKEYTLYIYNPNYKMVYALRGKDKLPFNVEEEPYYGEERFDPITGAVYEVHDNRFFLDIDFDNPIDAVAIEYKDKTGYFKIPVKYAYTDKEAYYKKLKEKEYQDNLKIIDVKISTNRDVANIYFKPLNDKYHRAEICLYTARGYYPDRGYMNHISVKTQPIGGKIDQLIGKYEIPEDKFFCSIDKLAKGTYVIKVVQYDKDDKELITSDYHYFDM